MHLSPAWPAAVLWRKWMRNAHCCAELRESSAEECEDAFSEPALVAVLSLQSLGAAAVRLVHSGCFHNVCFCIG